MLSQAALHPHKHQGGGFNDLQRALHVWLRLAVLQEPMPRLSELAAPGSSQNLSSGEFCDILRAVVQPEDPPAPSLLPVTSPARLNDGGNVRRSGRQRSHQGSLYESAADEVKPPGSASHRCWPSLDCQCRSGRPCEPIIDNGSLNPSLHGLITTFNLLQGLEKRRRPGRPVIYK